MLAPARTRVPRLLPTAVRAQRQSEGAGHLNTKSATVLCLLRHCQQEASTPGEKISPKLEKHSNTGPKPDDLYGKFTWRIEGFSEVSKRELRSAVFEVGGYRW